MTAPRVGTMTSQMLYAANVTIRRIQHLLSILPCDRRDKKILAFNDRAIKDGLGEDRHANQPAILCLLHISDEASVRTP